MSRVISSCAVLLVASFGCADPNKWDGDVATDSGAPETPIRMDTAGMDGPAIGVDTKAQDDGGQPGQVDSGAQPTIDSVLADLPLDTVTTPNVCGDGMRTGDEKCDNGRSGSMELGACNPECTGYYERKTIKHTLQAYPGSLGGPRGADALCESKFGPGYKALIVGGGRRATVTPNLGDGQTDWVLQKYTHYFNESAQLIWRTDAVALLGVRDGKRMSIYAGAWPDDGMHTYPWGGYGSDWVTQPENYSNMNPSGTCMGWTTSSSEAWATFPLRDLTVGSFEPCGSEQPLLCVEQ